MPKQARTNVACRAFRGSQCQFQTYVNESREFLEREHAVLFDDPSTKIEWRSPLVEDGYKEYQDRKFLIALGLTNLANELARFWPRRGPVWDGLALAHGSSGSYCLLLGLRPRLVCCGPSALDGELWATYVHAKNSAL